MQFPHSYFEDEVRDGFYVPSMMKHAWAAQLEVLKDIAEVCEKYHITWFADCGTLLGAVRHGGFIPWDDDMDICMKRADYQRFLVIAGGALPEGYSILSLQNDKEYDQLFARVVNSRQIRLDQPFLDKFHGFPFACGIDIFPMDFLPKDKQEEVIQRSLLQLVLSSAKILKNEKNISEDEIEKQIRKIEDICGVKIDRTRSLRNELYLLAEKLCMLYEEQESEEITLMPVWIDAPQYRTSKEYYREIVNLPFENMQIPVPAAYDAILRYRYGDYMKPVHTWDMHDYPFYRNQDEILRKRSGVLPQKYAFSVENLCGREHERKTCAKRRERKEAVFLPYKASAWDSLESIWKAADADPDCDAYVIPIPYYEKRLNGSFGEMHYESDGYPEYVPITRWDTFDFKEHQPDMIFIQNPYDEYNDATSVEPFFYSGNLKNYTRKLIYVPYFVTDEIDPGDERAIANMEYYVTVPGVIQADQVIVQSENMQRLYIDKLTEFAGEDTRKIWEEKIVGMKTPKEDKESTPLKEQLDIPEKWRRFIEKKDGSRKKVILYYTGLSSFIQYKERMIAKMKDVFRIFLESCGDVIVLWKPDVLIKTTLEYSEPEVYQAYCLLEKEFLENEVGILDKTADDERAVAVCDAYYGDASPMVQIFRNAGKPVMLQAVEM